MSWKDFFRKLLRIGAKGALETATSQMESGPVTAGNVLKPAGKAAAGAVAAEVLTDAAEKLGK